MGFVAPNKKVVVVVVIVVVVVVMLLPSVGIIVLKTSFING